ncbi:MAG: zf-HC2 domain-containing protein [Candidatus Acidiferrales bacterium]
MKCEDVEKGLIAFVDERATAAERRDVESHLAGCAVCRARVQELRSVSNLLGELPAIEPSFGFDARVRQRVAAEPQPGWFAWLVPQARLALSAAMLVALTVSMVKWPANRKAEPAPVAAPAAATSSDQDFEAVKDLGVLENYDVVTNMDALSQLVPAKRPQAPKPDANQTESND